MHQIIDILPLATGCTILAVLAISTVTDVTWKRIPNVLLLPALLMAIMLQVALNGLGGLFSAVAGMVIGLVFLLPLYAMGGMGAGDVKLLGVVGAFLGPAGVLVAGIATFIAGGVLALLFVAWRFVQPALDYAGYLATNFYNTHRPMVAPVQPSLISVRVQRIAYAPAITVGSIFAMWQQGLLTPLTIVSG